MEHRNIIIFSFGALLLISLVAMFLTVLNSDDQYSSIIYAIVMLYGVGVEVVVLMLLGLFHFLKGRVFDRSIGKMPIKDEIKDAQQTRRRELGKVYLLSAGLVLLVGFSACLGGTYLLTDVF